MTMTGPAYDENYVPPEIDESELETIGVGLYRVKGRTRRGDLYRPELDAFDRDIDQVLMARVDDGPTILPSGGFVERAEIRHDGKRLIVGWQSIAGYLRANT
jgi:hypothetical protein